MPNYDAKALYDEVQSGRLKLENLSDSGLTALKSYVYMNNLQTMSSEQPKAAKMNQNVVKQPSIQTPMNLPVKVEQPKISTMNNYPTSQPQAANATNIALSNMYKDYQKSLADNTVYAGTAPKQANVGQINKPSQQEISDRLFQSKVNDAIRKAQEIESNPNIKDNNLLGDFGSRLGVGIRETGGAGNFGGIVKGQMLQYLPQDVANELERQRLNLGGPISNTATDLIGQGIGFATPIGAGKAASTLFDEVGALTSKIPYLNNSVGKATRALVGGAGNVASKAVSKLPQRIQPTVLNAMKEAAKQVPGGAFLGAVDVPIRKDINPIDNPKAYMQSLAENTLLGAGFGAGASVVGSAAKGATKAISNKVNGELAQIADNIMKQYKFNVGQRRYDRFGGSEQASKSANGNLNMQRYKNAILTEDQIREIRRNNADSVFAEIADAQTKHLEKQQQLSSTYEQLPQFEKQRALEAYLERTKNDPKMQDFTFDKVRQQTQSDIEATLGRLSELDQAFESLPTEVQMALKDYEACCP